MKDATAPRKPSRMFAAVAAFCMVMLLSSQAMPFAVSRGVVLERDRISLPGDTEQNGVWETRDLGVQYHFSRSGGQLRISGTVRLADSIRYNASLLRDFRIGLIFVDGQGRVRQMRGLSTSGFPGLDEPMYFKSTIPIPADSLSMAFFYQGQASDSGNGSGCFLLLGVPDPLNEPACGALLLDGEGPRRVDEFSVSSRSRRRSLREHHG